MCGVPFAVDLKLFPAVLSFCYGHFSVVNKLACLLHILFFLLILFIFLFFFSFFFWYFLIFFFFDMKIFAISLENIIFVCITSSSVVYWHISTIRCNDTLSWGQSPCLPHLIWNYVANIPAKTFCCGSVVAICGLWQLGDCLKWKLYCSRSNGLRGFFVHNYIHTYISICKYFMCEIKLCRKAVNVARIIRVPLLGFMEMS